MGPTRDDEVVPPAGWYPDPQGRGLAYWDGHRWTEPPPSTSARLTRWLVWLGIAPPLVLFAGMVLPVWVRSLGCTSFGCGESRAYVVVAWVSLSIAWGVGYVAVVFTSWIVVGLIRRLRR